MHLQSLFKDFGSPYRIRTLICSLIFAVLPLSAMAQTEKSEEESSEEKTESTLPEVVVSASRIPVPAERVGSSVTVFDQEDFEKRQVEYVHELLREVPGVAVSQNSPGDTTQIRIRGAEGNHTLVVVDGIEMNDPVGADEFYLQHLPISLMGRVEVLRGPQSSIFGSEAIGGVINITSPIPREGTTTSVSIEHGSLNTTNAKAYFGIASGDSYGSVSANFIKSDGVSAKLEKTVNNTDEDGKIVTIQVPDWEPDGFEQLSGHFKTGVQISENLKVSTVAMLIKTDADYDGCGYPSSNQCIGKDKKRVFGVNLNYDQLDGVLSHKFSVSNTRHEREDIVNRTDEDSKIGKKSKIDYQGTFRWQTSDTDQVTIFALEEESSTAIGPYVAGGKGGKLKTKSYTLEQRMDFGSNVFASLSARHDDNSANNFKDHNTYRGTAAWVVNDDIRIHSSLGTGAKNPTVAELFGWAASWVPNPDLKPESSNGWDFGVEHSWEQIGLTVDVTYFRNEVTNLIDSVCVENCENNKPPDFNFNDDNSKSINKPGVSSIKGWEFTAHGTVNDEYDVSASVTISKGFDSQGRELIRRPSQIASFNVNREFSLWQKLGNANLNIQHTGKQLDYGNPEDLPEFTLAHLSASMELNPNLGLTGRIENLFDKDDYSEVRGYGHPGRTFSLGMKYSF